MFDSLLVAMLFPAVLDCPNCLYYSFQPCRNLLGSIGHTTDCTFSMNGFSSLRKHYRPDPFYILLVMQHCTENLLRA